MKKIFLRAFALFPTQRVISGTVNNNPPVRITGFKKVFGKDSIRKMGVCFLLIIVSFTSFSQTTYSMNSSNNWSVAAAWTLTTAPATSSPPNSNTTSAILASGVSATVDGNYSVLNLTIQMNGGLTVNDGQTLTVNGDLTINSNINSINVNGGTLIVRGNVVINGNVNINVGSTAGNSGSFQVDGNITSNNQNYNVNVNTNANPPNTTSSGTITVGGNVTIPGTGSNPNGPAGSINVGGTCLPAGSSSDQTFCYKANQNGMLPVILNAFHTSVTSLGVEFTWMTATEINFDYFNLQRSFNGEDFQTIAKVPGHGTTYEKHTYTFFDRFPLAGTSYYRLQSVDFDGYTETFQAVHVSFEQQRSLRVFPNPANGSLQLTLNFAPSEAVLIQIMALNGMEISRFQMSELVSSDITLNPGTYLVKVTSAEINTVIRIVSR